MFKSAASLRFLFVTTLALAASRDQAAAQLKPDEVPTFQLRARVTSAGGKKPQDKKFSFRFGVPSQGATAKNDDWSIWLKFQRPQVTATLKGYPAIYMKGYPVVVRLTVGGVVDPTAVEAELKFDGSDAVLKLSGELFGPRLGILVWRDKTGAPQAATMAQYNERYWRVLGEVDVPEAKRPRQFPIVDRFIGGDDDRRGWREGIQQLNRAGFSACEHGAMAGNCDSGYSCVYSSTMSWRSATQPLPKEVNPKLAFERLFSNVPGVRRAERDARRKSILDFVREDSKDLSGRLGANDLRKLDEYFAAVRDIELRIERAEKLPPVKTPAYPAPPRIPAAYEEHIRLMYDLIVLAFQADVTRVITCVVANEGSNKPYPFIEVSEGHHDLSHHGNDAAKKEKIRKINLFHTRQLGYLLQKLSVTREGDGTLLDHVMVAYGSGNSDGNRHNHDDLPILLAGGGCGTLKTGRHVRYPKETPLNNLWLAMLNRMDINVAKLGDSTGELPLLN